ncbi:integrase arm-type DNA-binding domain-containing protein [Novosphingobium sp. CECT 9465]|jgi:integrase|uniref:tyrosine-type recombinase/integrase n=1 Tax=Novosphingobium sp. CECT 9465 TaxID=2829794 RepID=UPI001E611402|nr:integrase arm-type DNA-binding domain-containing protein [Novosphingobium sp. CECT 9465]CAH0498240.1 Prophage integrase IntA [Novosphingobium sp. CECT 9465]
MSDGAKRKTGLTANAVKHARPKDKDYKLSDRDGLYLLVKTTGIRYWRMNYRFGGQQRTLSFGRWPEILLGDAREMLLEARRQLAKGLDPLEQAKLEKIAKSIAATNTFQAVAEEWLEKIEKEGLAPITLKKARWLLAQTYPVLGRRPISEITAHELLLVLKKIEASKRYDTANRIRSTCSQVFRYAIATARAERDICSDLRGALVTPRTNHRAAITTAADAGALLRAVEDYEGNALTRIALRLLPHLFVRPGELRWAEWSEFDFDKAVWTIPDHKMKMRRPHAVPLSRQALAIIGEIEHDASYSGFLFPSLRALDRPMSDNTINAALRRLGFSKDQMTGHGFRAMAATLLNEMGIWNPDAIERQLAHADGNSIRRAYARGQYWEERVRMMQHWSDYIDQLRDGATILRPKFGHSAS